MLFLALAAAAIATPEPPKGPLFTPQDIQVLGFLVQNAGSFCGPDRETYCQIGATAKPLIAKLQSASDTLAKAEAAKAVDKKPEKK